MSRAVVRSRQGGDRMTADGTSAGEARFDGRLALLLAMAMFVLVVDTSLMNVSISAVVRDIGTTVSGVQSAIALEALVSAAFILISSKIGDLFGRKRAYVLGLLGYAIGAVAMTLAQGLTVIIVCWAIGGRRHRRSRRTAHRWLHHDVPVVASRLPARGRDHCHRPVRGQPGARRAVHGASTHRRGRRGALGPRHGWHRPRHPRVAGG